MIATADADCEYLDPRIRRTRQLLQSAMSQLLETKDFEEISVQDITDVATVNRATFYAHYTDKFALLECTIGTRFNALLKSRGVTFDGTCASALKAILLGVCDYLAGSPGMESERHRQMAPHMESAVIAVIQRMILGGLKQNPSESALSPEMTATTISWAIFGAAKEWVHTPNRSASEEIVELVIELLSPLLRQIDTSRNFSK